MIICGLADYSASQKNISLTEVEISQFLCGDFCQRYFGCPEYDASEDKLD